MEKVFSVGIIGGGISGAVTAVQLADQGIDHVLFEKENSVVNGPPFCHLHAGGNLYPDIADWECRLLMKQSIEMVKLFPQSIDERPTFFSVPRKTKYEPSKIEARLKMLVEYYKELISEDPSNAVLGSPENYFKAYTKEDLKRLQQTDVVKLPKNADEWMRNSLELIDQEQLKMPVFMVQEFGWNMFRLAAQAQLALETSEYSNLLTNTQVKTIIDCRDQDVDYNWILKTEDKSFKLKYLINSCGFRTGEFDEILDLKPKRLIEFKAAYISKWKSLPGAVPELIFHGERGTPNGMAQLTPWSNDFYQIHGMTKDITLFKDGIVKSEERAQPEFKEEIVQKINNRWDSKELKDRTENAIDYISKFVPDFGSAEPGGPAMFGAQQVVGDNLNLRVAEVSFPSKAYARSEIIKASSALTVANRIIDQLESEGIVAQNSPDQDSNSLLASMSVNNIDAMAKQLTVERGYPEDLSNLVIAK